MLFLIAVLPSWLLVALVAFATFKLTKSRPQIAPSKPYKVMQSIFFITLALLGVALFTLFVTYEDNISFMSCKLGLYGRYISPAILIACLTYYFLVSKRSNDPALGFSEQKPFVYAVVLSHAIILIIFLRALVRCTV